MKTRDRQKEQRKTHRVATNLLVQFFRDSGDSTMHHYQKGIAENCSTHGMFIKTTHLFSKGSVFTMEFQVKSGTKQLLIQARAIVRWVQQLVTHPGMGVEFILFNGPGGHEFRNWLGNVSK